MRCDDNLWIRTLFAVTLLLGLSPQNTIAQIALDSPPVWTSPEPGNYRSGAWGDVDNDGDLDLAVGMVDGPVKVYHFPVLPNTVQTIWRSTEIDQTESVAWGDVDNDGDLDLAVGNLDGPNRLYINNDGALETTATWQSDEADDTRSVAWADFDNDGDLDLAVGNDGTPNRIYTNNGTALETTASWQTDAQHKTQSVAWGDFEGDGDLDLATGNLATHNFVYLNQDGQLQTAPGWTSPIVEETSSIAWGDVNNDGTMDLAVANQEQFSADGLDRIYLNRNGLANAESATHSLFDFGVANGLAWGDYDGDGDLDLATVGFGQDAIYTNVDGQLDPTPIWESPESEVATDLAWADFDADGDLDLAIARGSSLDDVENALYLNAGGVLTTTASWSDQIQADTRAVSWADVNDDGFLDLAFGNYNSPNVLFLTEEGALAETPAWTSDEADATTDMAWGDLDNDGDFDLVVSNSDSWRIYTNSEGMLARSAFVTVTYPSAAISQDPQIALGDMDNDGDLDLAVGRSREPLRIYRNNGNTIATEPTWQAASDSLTTGVAWGDVDGDGWIDLVTTSAIGSSRNNPSHTRLFINQKGRFNPTPDWHSGDTRDNSNLALGDMDNDGDLDLAVSSRERNQSTQIYLNDGGTLRQASFWEIGFASSSTNSIAWADFSANGEVDFAYAGQSRVGVLENELYQRGFPFASWSEADLASGDFVTKGYHDVLASDFDGDGDLDLTAIAGDADGAQFISIYANKLPPVDWDTALATGGFGPFDHEGFSDLAWGDIDSDGRSELFVASQTQSAPSRAYAIDGGRVERTAFWSANDADIGAALALGDVDLDGEPDLAVGNWGSPNAIYQNQGGQLQVYADGPWLSAAGSRTEDLAWGDVDNDGDLDLAVANHGEQNHIIENAHGQLRFPQANLWSASPFFFGTDVDWGDMDGDGDLDLAVGTLRGTGVNTIADFVYRNENGRLTSSPSWQSAEVSRLTSSVAWGDVDNDGDLDLAIGSRPFYAIAPEALYLNNNGALETTPSWESSGDSWTWDIAWGDVDNDGDLDLAVASGGLYSQTAGSVLGGPNRLYLNDGGTLSASAAWESADQDISRSVAWVDVDSDGDLDLSVGNQDTVDRIYLNNNGVLEATAAWTSVESVQTMQLEWSDVDGDGDPDLAAAVLEGSDLLYLNDGTSLQPTAAWQSTSQSDTTSVAWGDIDGDGDDDLLAAEQGAATKNPTCDCNEYADATTAVYLNNSGTIDTDASPEWSILNRNGTVSISLADADGDGDLDLASAGASALVYTNSGAGFPGTTEYYWSSAESDGSKAVAWADVDNDGDLDLAVANDDGPNQLYLSNHGQLEAVAAWSSTESEASTDLAWADVNSDGWSDLAISNRGAPTRIYYNIEGRLVESSTWDNGSNLAGTSVTWFDFDGDGAQDLLVTHEDGHDRLYGNQNGILQVAGTGLTIENPDNSSLSAAAADYDNDGDVDFAIGANNGLTLFSKVSGLRQTTSQDEPPSVQNIQPIDQNGKPYLASQIISDTQITIEFTLVDEDEGATASILADYSTTGGSNWQPATLTPDSVIRDLAGSPQGTIYTLTWNAGTDVVKSDNVVFRVRAKTNYQYTPILWPERAAYSSSFRMALPLFIAVEDAKGAPLADADVYAARKLLGQSDSNGLFNSGPLPPNTTVVALAQQAEFPSPRGAHDGWAYRVYQTNVAINEAGTPQLFKTTTFGQQTLTLQPTNALILFNLVVSIEWDATDEYMQDVADAIQEAADLLYDATDGQISFEQVSIYDNAVEWANADIQVSTKNVVHPHAFVNGVTDDEESHLIRVGRAWDGLSGAEGNWSSAEGYQTLVHEFGHYALGLYDEYFGYKEINGQLAGRTEAFCTGPGNREGDRYSTNASIMDYHYAASELADDGRWTEWCQKTAQHLLNDGQSDWATVKRNFGDKTALENNEQPRWRLVSPDERAGVGEAVAGPYSLPEALPFPKITINNDGADPEPFLAQVCYNGQPYPSGAWVTLTKVNGTVLDQGLTNDIAGALDILGAEEGDKLQVVSVNGVLSASQFVEKIRDSGSIALRPVNQEAAVAASGVEESDTGPSDTGPSSSDASSLLAETADALPPFFRLWPTISGGSVDGVRLVVARTNPNDSLTYVITGSDDIGPSAAIPFDESQANHNVQVSFVPAGRNGFAKAIGSSGEQFIELNVDFRLQQAENGAETDLFSNDGNLMLHLDPQSLATESLTFLIASPWGLPGPTPDGQTIVGEIYDITAAENVGRLLTPAVLRLRYDGQAVGTQSLSDVAIHRWNEAANVWQPVDSIHNEERSEVVASITELGIYGLMAVSGRIQAAHSPSQPEALQALTLDMAAEAQTAPVSRRALFPTPQQATNTCGDTADVSGSSTYLPLFTSSERR